MVGANCARPRAARARPQPGAAHCRSPLLHAARTCGPARGQRAGDGGARRLRRQSGVGQVCRGDSRPDARRGPCGDGCCGKLPPLCAGSYGACSSSARPRQAGGRRPRILLRTAGLKGARAAVLVVDEQQISSVDAARAMRIAINGTIKGLRTKMNAVPDGDADAECKVQQLQQLVATLLGVLGLGTVDPTPLAAINPHLLTSPPGLKMLVAELGYKVCGHPPACTTLRSLTRRNRRWPWSTRARKTLALCSWHQSRRTSELRCLQRPGPSLNAILPRPQALRRQPSSRAGGSCLGKCPPLPPVVRAPHDARRRAGSRRRLAVKTITCGTASVSGLRVRCSLAGSTLLGTSDCAASAGMPSSKQRLGMMRPRFWSASHARLRTPGRRPSNGRPRGRMSSSRGRRYATWNNWNNCRRGSRAMRGAARLPPFMGLRFRLGIGRQPAASTTSRTPPQRARSLA